MNLPIRSFVLSAIVIVILAVGSGCTAEAKKARRLERAHRYLASGAYDSAEIEYRNVLQIDRLNPTAIAQLGIIYFEQGRGDRVFPFLEKARELLPGNLEVRIRRAQLLAASRPQDARDEAWFVLERQPQHELAPLLLAETTTNTTEATQARARLGALPLKAQTGAPVLTALAILEGKLGRGDAALTLFEQAVAANPKFAPGQVGLGMLHWQKNDMPRAKTAFANAISAVPARSPVHLQYARFQLATGQAKAARQYLEEVNKQAPDFIPALLLTAEIYGTEQKFDEGLAAVGRALSRDPLHPEALLLGGRLRLAKGDVAKAVIELERAVGVYPNSAPLQHQLGLAYIASGDSAKAVPALVQAVTSAPGFAPAVLALAEIQIRQGNAAAAAASLGKLIQQQPALPQPRALLAQALLAQRNVEGALEVYRQMAEVFPRNPQTALLTGFALIQVGRSDTAREAFNRALEFDPEFFPALEQLVNFDLQAKDFAGARQRLGPFITRHPNDPGAQFTLARIFLAAGENAQAEAALLNTIKLKPDLTQPYMLLARHYLMSAQRDKALANLHQAAAANPKDVEALMIIGVLHEQMKDYVAAREAYEKLLARNPRFSPALNNLAFLHSEQTGDLDQAFELAQRARTFGPGEPHTADTLGWILYRRGQYPWALTLLAESAEKLSQSPDVQFHLGLAHYMLGDEQPARTALERALGLSQDFAGASEAREALAVLNFNPGASESSVLERLETRATKKLDPVAMTKLGAWHERSKDFPKAAAAFQAALKASPNNIGAALGMIRLHRLRNEAPQAIELAKATRKIAPTNAEVAQILGELAFESGDHKWSFSLLQEANQAKPSSAEALYALAEASYSIGRVAEAEAAMRRVIDLDPHSNTAGRAREFLELAEVFNKPAERKALTGKVEQLVSSEPNNVPALMALGAMRELEGNSAAAINAYERALGRFPEFSPAQRQLALAYVGSSTNDSKALELTKKAREAFPDDPQLAKNLGKLLYHKGEFRRAATILYESSRRLTKDAELFYYLGLAQQQAGEKQAAKLSLQQSITLGLTSDLAAKAERALANVN